MRLLIVSVTPVYLKDEIAVIVKQRDVNFVLFHAG